MTNPKTLRQMRQTFRKTTKNTERIIANNFVQTHLYTWYFNSYTRKHVIKKHREEPKVGSFLHSNIWVPYTKCSAAATNINHNISTIINSPSICLSVWSAANSEFPMGRLCTGVPETTIWGNHYMEQERSALLSNDNKILTKIMNSQSRSPHWPHLINCYDPSYSWQYELIWKADKETKEKQELHISLS